MFDAQLMSNVSHARSASYSWEGPLMLFGIPGRSFERILAGRQANGFVRDPARDGSISPISRWRFAHESSHSVEGRRIEGVRSW